MALDDPITRRRAAAGVPAWAMPGLALLLLVLTTADVVVYGGAHVGDRAVFAGGLPLRSGLWHAIWRVLVMGGQYWLAGTAAALTALWAAWRCRSVAFLVGAALWLMGTELAHSPARAGQRGPRSDLG
jgi:hypothetical protein